jgi:asparagine synthase (glutamine-hydrolysing)
MCGIAGQVRRDGAPVERGLVERMCAAQEHRGPDSRGVFCEGEAGIGIQRLRIIDIAGGDQPIFNEDRSVAVVLNGEIYNFRELRERLEQSGHRFATAGDTEAIVHLYEEEGTDCVRSLHGMFAFALWDMRRRRLLVARDRVGKKPLFYSERPGALSFASELSALLEDREIPRDIDHRAIDAYLAYDFVPAPLSAYAAVRKLPPGCTLTYSDGRVAIERYWSLDYGRKRAPASEAELHEEIREAIRRAVRKRLISDVPLGAFLSGGIDSSAVVAAMAEASSEPVKTFSIGFTTESHNELPYARLIAAEFGTDHHEHVVEPDAVEILPRIVRHYGEPFADSSAIPSFYLAEMARRHVTVALNGDGGDESFAGYQRYTTNALLGRLDGVPRPLRRAAGAAGRLIPADGNPRSRRSQARRLCAALPLDPQARYIAQISSLDRAGRSDLYTREYAQLLGETATERVIGDRWEEASAQGLLDRMLEVDVATYLPGDLLTKMDIATMASSLEARSPLLDHELMELAASLPPEAKAHGGKRKVALRGALGGWVPDEILDAPKRGFEVPIADWFRKDLRGFARDLLLDPRAVGRGMFEPAAVAGLLDRHAAGREDNSARIWALVVLELWQQHANDGPAALPAAA